MKKRKSLLVTLFVFTMALGMTGCGSFASKADLNANQSEQLEEVKPTKLEPLDQQEPQEQEVEAVETQEEKVENENVNQLAVDMKEDLAEASQEGVETSEEQQEVQEQDDRLQIVYLGDSIFDNARDGSGIPGLTSMYLDAKVYNLAMGGTSAGLLRGEQNVYEKWDSRCLLGMVHVLAGDVSSDILNGYHAKEVLQEFDPQKTDIFVIEYGINDFLSGIPATYDADERVDEYCYYGAIGMAVEALKRDFPTAEVVYCAPHYVQFWNNGVFIGDINSVDAGLGTLNAYAQAGRDAASKKGAYCFFPYDDVEIDAYNADECLEDGIHLTQKGRQMYAEKLAKFIQNIEMNAGN